MSLRTTPTIAICLAAGLAGGIALARPADSDPVPVASAEPASATADDTSTAAGDPGDGYGADEPTDTDTAATDTATDEVDLGSDPYAGLGDAAADTASEPAPADEPVADAAAPVSIDIEGFAFSGATTAAPGATLTVTNLDSAPHTVTAGGGEFDTGNLGQGESATITLPTVPGTYTFFCAVHPSMTGDITIG